MRWLVPLLVFLAALAIRLPGIGWGLKNDLHNQSYHPDEEVIYWASQRVEPAKLKFTPGFYNYGTLYLTMLRVASDMTAAYTGSPDPKSEDSFWSYVARCNLAGRLISALAGAGTVLLVFFILLRICGLIGGLSGAAVLAVAPAHVVHSRFQTVDVTAVFFLATAALFAFKLIPREGEDPPSEKQVLKWLIAAGAFTGMSAGTKYTGLLGLLTILVVLFFCRRPTILKEGLIAAAAMFGAFFLSCPGVLLDNAAFMHDFKFEMLHTATGHGLVFEGTANGFLYHLGNLFQGFGTIATLMGVAALVYAAYRRHVWAIALLAFVVPYYILIGRAEDKYMRYTFPLYVGLAAGFGWAVAKGHQRGGYSRMAVAAGILAIGGVDYGGLIGTVRFTAYMTGEDPRDGAARYLKQQCKDKPDAVAGLPEDPWFWSPPLFPDSTISRQLIVKRAHWMQEMRAASNPKVTFYMTPDGNPTQFDKRLITDIKPDYVTYSSFEYEIPQRLQGRSDISNDGKGLSAEYKEFGDALAANYEGDREFGDSIGMVQDMEYVQPHVLIWKRKGTH